MLHMRAMLSDPAVGLTAVLMFLLGAMTSAFGPYVPILAVREFGLGNAGYAVLLVASTLIGVTASVYSGIRADQKANRRNIALFSCWALCIGCTVMTFAPGRVAFVVAHVLIFPLATLFSQLFAQERLAVQGQPDSQRNGALSLIRAMFSAPYVLILPILDRGSGKRRADLDDLSGRSLPVFADAGSDMGRLAEGGTGQLERRPVGSQPPAGARRDCASAGCLADSGDGGGQFGRRGLLGGDEPVDG